MLAVTLEKRNMATVASSLDYCNVLYAGLLMKVTQKFQLVQKALARVLSPEGWII